MNDTSCTRAYWLGVQIAIQAYGISVPGGQELSHLKLLHQIAAGTFSVYDPEYLVSDKADRLLLQQINTHAISSDREIAQFICKQIELMTKDDNNPTSKESI